MVRTWVAVASGIVALAVSACSVRPATDVTPTSATLNARLVNPLQDQTLEYHFEWGPTWFPSSYSSPFAARGQDRSLPAGSDWTDIAQPAADLEPGTEYTFRVCGTFKPSGTSGCLPGRTVTTAPDPTGDVVRAGVGTSSSTVSFSYLSLTALSDADGSHLRGAQTGLVIIWDPFREFTISGAVSCARVSGQSAVVGFNGTFYVLFDGRGDAPDAMSLVAPGPRASQSDCGPLKPGEELLDQSITHGQIVIVDR